MLQCGVGLVINDHCTLQHCSTAVILMVSINTRLQQRASYSTERPSRWGHGDAAALHSHDHRIHSQLSCRRAPPGPRRQQSGNHSIQSTYHSLHHCVCTLEIILFRPGHTKEAVTPPNGQLNCILWTCYCVSFTRSHNIHSTFDAFMLTFTSLIHLQWYSTISL